MEEENRFRNSSQLVNGLDGPSRSEAVDLSSLPMGTMNHPLVWCECTVIREVEIPHTVLAVTPEDHLSLINHLGPVLI